MSGEIVYEMAAFTLPTGESVLAALKGSTNSYLRGALVRRWSALLGGTREALLERSCQLAAEIEDGHVEYKPKPEIIAEDLIAVVERKLKKAAPLGQAYASVNQPRIAGFCLRVEREAIAQWRGDSPLEAARFLAMRPDLRSPYGTLVLEKTFPPTAAGLAQWRSCASAACYLQQIVVVNGGGEI